VAFEYTGGSFVQTLNPSQCSVEYWSFNALGDFCAARYRSKIEKSSDATFYNFYNLRTFNGK